MDEDEYVRHLERMGVAASAARAAYAAVMPIRELINAAYAAGRRLACARANELWLRAVALADATLSAESLVTAYIRHNAATAIAVTNTNNMEGFVKQLETAPDISQRITTLMDDAWQQNPRVVALSRRNLEVLGNRWRAGTLSTLSAEERVYFLSLADVPLRGVGARLCATATRDPLNSWPRDALDAAALRNVHDLVCALLEADARGELFPGTLTTLAPGLQLKCTDQKKGEAGISVRILWEKLRVGASSGRCTPQTEQLVRDLGLSSMQMDALSGLAKRIEDATSGDHDMASLVAREGDMRETGKAAAARAAAAEAKYGLQRCALPACAAQEPAARTYKRCSRCGQAYYCCVEHQQADWRRHKHEDGCKKPA